MSAKTFRRRAGEAIWSQISRSIEEQIVAGSLPSGTRLPTETQLAASFEVNRHTLRRALRELVRKGLITATPRRGTIVSRRRISFAIVDLIATQDQAGGRRLIDRLLTTSIGRAPKEMSQWLGIAERASVIGLEFVRIADKIPVCLTSTWLPADRFGRITGLVERLGSLEKALATIGVAHYTLSETRISSQPATFEELKQLDIPLGASVLVVDLLFVDEDKEPIFASHHRCAADRVQLVM